MKKIILILTLVLLLTACGTKEYRSGSAHAIEEFQIEINKISQNIGAVLQEIETDTIQLQQGEITKEQLIQRLDKKISKTKEYQQELDSLIPPPIYREGYNYMQSVAQKTLTAVEMIKQGIITDDPSLADPLMNLLTEIGQDAVKARTSLTQATQQITPAGQLQGANKIMSIEEYKSFMASMDTSISGTLQIIDQAIQQYRQQIITKQEFIASINQGVTTIQTAESAFINAMPPEKFADGHIVITKGISLLTQGMQTMKQAAEQSNDELYQQAVQSFATGIQKIQQGNEELGRNL